MPTLKLLSSLPHVVNFFTQLANFLVKHWALLTQLDFALTFVLKLRLYRVELLLELHMLLPGMLKFLAVTLNLIVALL